MNFVNYEIALKLKGKGFREECLYHYLNGVLKPNSCRSDYEDEKVTTEDLIDLCNDLLEEFDLLNKDVIMVDAPTIEQVLEWLRNEKKIYVYTIPYASFSTNNKVIWNWFVKFNSNGESASLIQGEDSFISYEESVTRGIEYVLDNLI